VSQLFTSIHFEVTSNSLQTKGNHLQNNTPNRYQA